MDLALDRAEYSPAVIDAADAIGANLILHYAYDPDVMDVNGWAGNWTPGNVGACRARGKLTIPIFTFVTRFGLPTYDKCLQVLGWLGHPADPNWGWVATDREGDAVPPVDWQIGFNQFLGQHGYRSMPYGTAGTLADGCLTGAAARWLAQWPHPRALQPVPDSLPFGGSGAWQFTNSVVISGVDVDVSIHNLASANAVPVVNPTPQPASTDWWTSGGDDMVLLTTPKGRVDFIHVGTDGGIWHRWKDQNFDDIAVENESWGAPGRTADSPGKKLVKVAAAYDDGGNTFDVVAAADDGTVWALQMNVAGGVHNGWWAIDPDHARVLVETGGQAGPAGPPGPAYDDTWVRSALAKVKADLP